MENYMAVVEYDGTDYSGFQVQPGGVKTICGELKTALRMLLKEDTNIRYAGRTDAGVHATNQVINFKTEKKLNLYRFKWSLNSILPGDIGVREIRKVNKNFDSKRDARLREYSYFVVNNNYQSVFLKRYSILVIQELDLKLMRKASKYFIGMKDFRAFCSSGDNNSTKIRKVSYFTITKGRQELIIFKIAANGFLYNMVRIIVGTVLDVGAGKESIQNIMDAFETGDRSLAGKTVPAKGLFLTRLVY